MERKAQKLSKREQEILYRLARRLSNEEIAEELHLALSSVKWYVRQILNKLGADNRREAVEKAAELGLLVSAHSSIHTGDGATSLPSGIVTFLFTDIEGSTPLWEKMPEAMQVAVAQHHAILRQSIEASGGQVTQVIGDAFQSVFRLVTDGLGAALAAQRSLRDAPWGPTGLLKVRMGLHTGPAELDPLHDAPYAVSHTLNRAARIMSAGHGRQILLSQECGDLVSRDLPDGVSLTDLGEHYLKGLRYPEHLYQVNSFGLPGVFPPLRSEHRPGNNLPLELTSFIGRQAEISQVQELLREHRLVTLTGSGGVGKTSLALCIARQMVDRFPAGVWLVELASLSDPALVSSTVARALSLDEVPGVPILDTLIAYLKNRRLLLVIDNCEHLLLACAFLFEELLKKCSHLHILATSREFLNLPGETSFRVPSLPVPDLRHLPPLAQLAQIDAVRLFVERANQVMPGFALDKANAQYVVTITHRLDGIPLAIELAAACVRTMPVSQINSRLDRTFILLTGGARTALPRQQALKATIDWSYALLSEKERMLIQRLSVFSGGWSLEAAEAVCVGEGIEREEILPLLSLLVDKSLIMRIFVEGVPAADRDYATRSADVTPGAGRYRMLETIRQYSRDRMLATESEEALSDRHLRYYCQWCEAVEPQLIGAEQMHWMDCLEGELDNLRLALEWSLHDQVEEGLRLAASLEYFWKNRSHWMEGQHWLESLLDREAENRGDQPLHADTDRTADLLLCMKSYNALISLFNAYSGSPSAHRWVALLTESIELCRQMGEGASLELVKTIILNASVLFWRGESEKAIALLEDIQSVCQQKQFLFEEMNATYLLGYYSMLIGELQKGQAWLDTALALARRQESPDLIAACLGILGVTVGFHEDQARGKVLLKEGLEIFWTIGNLQEYHWNSVLLLHFCQDRQAIQRAKTAYIYYQDTRNDNRLIWTFANLIYAEWSNGQTKNAEQWGKKAFSFVSSDPQLKTLNLRNHSFVFLWLARLAFTRDDISQACRHIQTALPWFANAGRFLAFDYTHFLDFLAVLLTAMGDYPLAARLFGAVAKMYSHYRIGLGARQQSEHEEAVLRLQDVLAKETFTDAWEEGRAMTIGQAVQVAITAFNENKGG